MSCITQEPTAIPLFAEEFVEEYTGAIEELEIIAPALKGSRLHERVDDLKKTIHEKFGAKASNNINVWDVCICVNCCNLRPFNRVRVGIFCVTVAVNNCLTLMSLQVAKIQQKCQAIKRRPNLSNEAVEVLRKWFKDHEGNPYPTAVQCSFRFLNRCTS